MTEKVLLLTFEFPPHPGGIGTYSFQIAANFHAMGVPIAVLATPNVESDEENEAFDRAQEFPIRRFRRWKSRPLKAVGRVVELLVFCWRHHVKWIYACSHRAAYIALVGKILLRVPYFLVGYGSEYSVSSRKKRLIMREALGLFAISQYTAALVRAQSDRTVTVIPLGADLRQFDPDQVKNHEIELLRKRYDLQGNPILLSVGRLNARKGHDVTLHALARIKGKYPDVQLVIIGASMAGEEAYETGLRRFVQEACLAQNVRFISRVRGDELRAFYELADVFILSSRSDRGDVEGFGIVLIEANAMRTPVVASSAGGVVEAVEDGRTGFLYKPEDTDDLADKVLRLLRDKSLRLEMGDYGRERALKEFNWQVVADRTWTAITTMLSEVPDS